MAARLLLLLGAARALVPPRPASCPPTALCVQRCCPPGHVYSGHEEHVPRAEEGAVARTRLARPRCVPHPGSLPYSPEVDTSFRPREVRLVGEARFRCRPGASLVSAEELIAPVRYRLTQSSQLQVFLDLTDFVTFNYEDFCVAFLAAPDEATTGGGIVYNTEAVRTTYSVCEDPFPDTEDTAAAQDTVYPVAIFISDFFVLLTLVTYCLVSEYRTNLFGRITIGFLINVFLGYLLVGLHYSLDLRHNEQLLGTAGCELLGYLIQHTHIALFFWMSAMALHITRTMLNSFSENKASSSRTLALNILYAQGMPLLISIVTLIMDSQRDREKEARGDLESSSVLPRMGYGSCWLFDEPEAAFSRSPEFLYFYLVISLLLGLNILCFLLTGASLLSHWWQMRGLAQGSINELFKTQLRTVTKLFFIMGIQWTSDVVSAAVRHSASRGVSSEEGRRQSYNIRIALDILNLLTGVLIFLSLVCTRVVWARVKEAAAKLQYSAVSRSSTSRTQGGDEVPLRVKQEIKTAELGGSKLGDH